MTPPLVISVLQALDLAAVVTDAAGRDIRETARLSRLLAQDADGYDVRARLLQLVRKRLTRNGDTAPVAVETRRGTYTLLAVKWPEPDGTVALGIGLATVSGNLAVDPSVRQRFGLTPRESDVASRLAAGASSREVAESLGMSVHTARRHTERVLQKCNVRRRAGVAAALYAAWLPEPVATTIPRSSPAMRP
ncbi:MAG TPA: helix-turn-helix transcriptional regulator [Gemmatimonadaceae bacterium]|nr:helix-turn-helix transcriptional regulator [Gemmatimonadaceae bacterium]